MVAWVTIFWPLALVALPFGTIAVRAFVSGILLDDSGVKVRGFFRTQRATWDEVVHVRDAAGSSTGLAWRIPEFVLSERTIKAQDFRTLRRSDSPVDAVISVSKRHLQDRGRRPFLGAARDGVVVKR